MKNFLYFITLVLSISCTSQDKNQPQVKRVDQAQWTDMTSKEKSPQLIDVRTPEEYSKGHLDGAVNIDFFSPTFMKDAEAELDKEHAIYIYCKSGGRSGKASAQLQEAGFTEIYDLSEGYSGWKH